jgi:NADH-quinone oxidoreductase subunit F
MPGQQLLMTFAVTATSHSLADYVARGGYATIRKALTQLKPEDVTKEVTASGLLGHGGAAFPAGRKWGVVHLNDHQPHYLCANADEGEPGTFKDRWILENAPHLLLESMLLAAYALQVRNAFVYIRGEFDLPYRRLAAAVEEAYAAGYLGERILGTEFACDIVIYRGAGSYVCGEASGLLSSIEGKRGYPRNRPPRLTVKGLFQRPTVVNNVETLSNVAGVIMNGADAYRKVGTAKCPGTQLVSISGHIARPGVYEVEYGYPMAKFLREDCGGMLPGQALKCIVPGGISTKVLTAAEVEPLTFDHQSFAGAGSSLGSGGMIAIA